MIRKHRVWYSIQREDKGWSHEGKWIKDVIAPCTSTLTFHTLKQVTKHLNKKANQSGLFRITKWFIKHGKRWAIDYKVYPMEAK